MWLKWLPWKYLIRKMAHSHGFLDPVSLLARVRGFSQPSEVQEPIELLRAGVILHARGLVNSRAIQQNLDWVWPWWVNRQFDPEDPAFIPRSFSLTHINLTHRNWTALGIPDMAIYPLVDPGGDVTPWMDGWSLEGWVYNDEGRLLAPSRLLSVQQYLSLEENIAVETLAEENGMSMGSRAEVVIDKGIPLCDIRYIGKSESPGWMVIALRPYNPEGVSFIHRVRLDRHDRKTWFIEDKGRVFFETGVEKHLSSNYQDGDVSLYLGEGGDKCEAICEVGMCTAAAMFRLQPGIPRQVEIKTTIGDEGASERVKTVWPSSSAGWKESLKGYCNLSIPDKKMEFLYDAALRTLLLLAPGDVYPGPYTYRRFWFRDGAFMIHALLCLDLIERAEGVLDRFPARQNAFGFFHSQDGEWDSNGEALWIMNRFCQMTGDSPKNKWLKAIEKGANWIIRKRIPPEKDPLYGGLLPAGFSAEHLGANDHYYWDNFWSIAGLKGAASMMAAAGKDSLARKYSRIAGEYLEKVEKSLARARERIGRPAMPAAPLRRLDAGAIGSISAGYPLQLWKGKDERIVDSAEWLMEKCFLQGCFFQDMVHSGINAYLTLHVAQLLLRSGNKRSFELIDRVADMASPTGQWPEAIHPWTGGGCMGDGQHAWAAAEWLMIMRNSLVLEEIGENRLILGAGLRKEWMLQGETVALGPTPTKWGKVHVRFSLKSEEVILAEWEGSWFRDAPDIEIRIPGISSCRPEKGISRLEISMGGGSPG